MPRFANIADVLKRYQSRYRYLEAFVDDVDEFRSQSWGETTLVGEGPGSALQIRLPDETNLRAEISGDRGVARFSLDDAGGQLNQIEAAAIGGLIGAALGAASAAKEGLLGGLALGILVGGLLGKAASPPRGPERVLALQFVPDAGEWKLYDGSLLRWATSHISPSAA